MTTRFDSRSLRAREVLLAGVFFALATGLLHVAVVWVRRYGLHEFTFTSRELIWMSPVAYLPYFLGPALLLILIALVWRPVTLFAAAVVYGFVMLFGILLLFPRIDQYASMALAAGASVQLARFAARRPEAWRRAFAVGVPAMAAVIIATSLALQVRRRGVERRMMGEYPAAPSDAPSVLLLILDTVRASSMSLYGYQRATTPRLAQWARNGTTFDYAVATAPWTLPSHSSIMTGRRTSDLTVNYLVPLDTAETTLAEVLRASGYATGGFVGNPWYTHSETGLEQGFARYEDYAVTPKQTFFSATYSQSQVVQGVYFGVLRDRSLKKVLTAIARFRWDADGRYPAADRKSVAKVNGDFLRWQAKLGRRPFFAFLNYFDAHANPKPSPAFARRFSERPTDRDLYDGAVANIDDEIDKLLRILRQRGVLDNTIVIVTADHGEQFGDHGGTGHGHDMYLQLLRVPLVISYPGHVPAGARVTHVTSLRNLPATVVDLAKPRASRSFPGTSLRTLWDGPAPDTGYRARSFQQDTNPGTGRETIDLSVIDDSLHFLRKVSRPGPDEQSVNGRAERVVEHLYRYREDSTEANDLRATAAGEALSTRYRALLPTTRPERVAAASTGRKH